jgi:hypothetical protein
VNDALRRETFRGRGGLRLTLPGTDSSKRFIRSAVERPRRHRDLPAATPAGKSTTPVHAHVLHGQPTPLPAAHRRRRRACLLTGWALPHAFALPGEKEDGYGGLAAVGALDRWASPPGAVCAGLAIVSLLVAGIARRPARPAARALATALAVLATVGPGVWVGLVALGPGAVGGEQSLAAGHVHSHAGHSAAAVPEAIEFRPGSGRAGGHFLVAVTPPARHTALGLGLVIATVLVFTAGAVGHLRGRSAPAVRAGFEGGLA